MPRSRHSLLRCLGVMAALALVVQSRPAGEEGTYRNDPVPPLSEQVIYQNDWDAQWGQWFREYAQSFVASAPGNLAWVAVRGTSGGEGEVALTVSVWEDREGRWVELGDPRQIALPDDGQARARWGGGNVRLERGRRYQVRFSAEVGWCVYWGSDNYSEGEAFADGKPVPDRDLFCTVCLDSAPADLHIRSVSLDRTTADRGPNSLVQARLALENRGESPAVLTGTELTFRVNGADVSDASPVSRELEPIHVPGLSSIKVPHTIRVTDDAPLGDLQVGARVRWFDQGDNLLSNPSFEADPAQEPRGWTVWAPGQREGSGFGVSEALSRTGRRCFQMGVTPRAQGGSLTVLESVPVPVGAFEYRAGVWYRTAKQRNVNRGTTKRLLIVPKNADSQPVFAEDEVHLRLRDVNSWWHEEISYQPAQGHTLLSLSLRMMADAGGQEEAVWWDDAYLLPIEALRLSELPTGAQLTIGPRQYAADPDFLYLYTDRETKGDWIGRYGEELAVLCAAGPGFSNVTVSGLSGAQPRPSVEAFRPEFGRGCARWRWAKDVDDRRALVLPVLGLRQAGSWDDEGEVFPLDYPGPNLGLKVQVPEGWHRLALYFLDWDWQGERRHNVVVRDEEDKVQLLLHTGAFDAGLYKCLAVKGPRDLTVVIERHRGFTVVVSGIFLDRIGSPQDTIAPVAQTLSGTWLSARLNALGRAWQTAWPQVTAALPAADPAASPAATPAACAALLERARRADHAETRLCASLAAAEQARVTGHFQLAQAGTQELRAALRQWANEGPEPFQHLLHLGEVLTNSGQHYAGRCAFDVALDMARAGGEGIPPPRVVSGECLRKAERVHSGLARLALVRWFEREPGKSTCRAPEGTLRLGRMYHAFGAARSAEEVFEEWLQRCPDNPLRPQVLFQLAFVRANLWDVEGVKQALALMKQDHPQAVETEQALKTWGNIRRPQWPYGPAGP